MRRHLTPTLGGRDLSPRAPPFRREPSAPPAIGLPRPRLEHSPPPRRPARGEESGTYDPVPLRELKGERSALYKKLRELQKKIVSLFEFVQ